jgi:methylmalonyl-CoA mutase cobalamin-binding domain/chain
MSDRSAKNAVVAACSEGMSAIDTTSSVDGVRASSADRPLRVLMAKVGLDGHDRGLRVVARILRDAGFEVVYAGLRQSPETIAAMSAQEDVDVVGVSMHNGAHLTLAPAVVGALRSAGLDVPVVVGGIVPKADIGILRSEGVAAVLGPGASNEEVVATMVSASADRHASSG